MLNLQDPYRMHAREHGRAYFHRSAGHDAPDLDTRVWRFLLAANAERRAAEWLRIHEEES